MSTQWPKHQKSAGTRTAVDDAVRTNTSRDEGGMRVYPLVVGDKRIGVLGVAAQSASFRDGE